MSKDPLAELIDDYRHRFSLNDQLPFYAGLGSLEAAIDYAALAKRPDGKRHAHQCRLKREQLLAVKHNLLENHAQLRDAKSFADIIRLVRACAVAGFGELAIYDAALRLAAYFDRLPEYVYLHAGTRQGAAALGLKVDREYLTMAELPLALQALQPYEAEDFLCIYKEQLGQPQAYAGANATGCHTPELPPGGRCHPVDASAEMLPSSGCAS